MIDEYRMALVHWKDSHGLVNKTLGYIIHEDNDVTVIASNISEGINGKNSICIDENALLLVSILVEMRKVKSLKKEDI